MESVRGSNADPRSNTSIPDQGLLEAVCVFFQRVSYTIKQKAAEAVRICEQRVRHDPRSARAYQFSLFGIHSRILACRNR